VPPRRPTDPPVEEAPKRQMRPLSDSQIGLRELQIRDFVCTLQPPQVLEDCFEPLFFANVGNLFSVSSIIVVFDAAGTFFAEFIVRAVSASNAVRGTKGAVKLALLRHITFDPVSSQVLPPVFEVVSIPIEEIIGRQADHNERAWIPNATVNPIL
jgi:hypothetical protein